LLRFKGFRDQGKVNIKGLEGVHLLWIDEAQQLSKETLDIIIPTLRKDNAKIFFTMNRTLKDDPVFVAMKDDPDCLHIHIDYFENPHCPDTSKREAEKQKARNIEDYNHIWLGEPLPQALNAAFRGVDACATGELCEPVKGAEYVLGVDLARSVDYTVLSILNKKTKNFDYIERLENENRTSWNYQVEKIKAVAQKYNNAQVIVDSTGVGDPIVENLQREGVNVYYHQKPDSDSSTPGIKFSSINKENLIEKLKVAIELKLITYPNIKYYVDELREFICETTSAGRHKYSAPDGKHDDCVISCALAVWGIRDQIYYKEPVVVVPTGADKFWARVTKDSKKHNNSLHGEENEVNIEADGEDISE
jgi:phage terminase large subunit-like protein